MCPRAFATSSQLKNHRLRHSGIRPHACAVCSRRFVDAENLRVHMRRHEGVRPFVCALCRKAFVDQWSLTKHRRTHADQTGEVSPVAACLLCDKTYSDSANLSRHMRTRHRGKQQQGPEGMDADKKDEEEEESKHSIWTIMRDLSVKLPDQVRTPSAATCSDP